MAVEGGAMSLLSGLTCPHKLGGIFGLSCYLPMLGKLKDMIAEKQNANKDTKIFMGHGDADQTIRHEWGELTREKLKEWGYEVDFRTYRYAPSLSTSLGFTDLDLAAFLTQRLPRKLTISRLSLTGRYLRWRRNKVKEVYDFKAVRK